jgi:plasmid stability protein
MASLTVRNLEEETKRALRLRAARHGNSLEVEVRTILHRAAREDVKTQRRHNNLYDAIRELVVPYGGFELEMPERSRPTPTIN